MRMRRWMAVLVMVLLCCSVTACKKQVPDPAAYETYTSEENGFSVVLPRGYVMEEDTRTEDGQLGMARFTMDGGEAGIVLSARSGGEEPLPAGAEQYREQNPGEEVIAFTDLSKADEFDGYKVMVKVADTGKIGLLYVFRFADTEVTIAAKAENREKAELLEGGLDQIRLSQGGGGVL